MAGEIFLSYRRSEGSLAAELQERLESAWGFGNQVFRDISTPGGEKWEEFILGRLEQCRVVLAVIGPDWEYSRAGSDPTAVDYVQVEFDKAKEVAKPVLMVEIGRSGKPAVEELPPELRAKQHWQARRVKRDLDDFDLRQIVDSLKLMGVTPARDTDPFSIRGSFALRTEERRIVRQVLDASVADSTPVPFLIVTGDSGVGRNALVRAIAGNLRRQRMVLAGDYDIPARHRSYAVLTNWFTDLVSGTAARDAASRGLSTSALARILVDRGQDLLSRAIAPADGLADLGDDNLVLDVMRGATRVDGRQVAYNRQRIGDQARQVLTDVQELVGRPLVAMVGELDRADAASLEALAYLRDRWTRPGELVFVGTCPMSRKAQWLGHEALRGAQVVQASTSEQEGINRVERILSNRGIRVDGRLLREIAEVHRSPFYSFAALNFLASRGEISAPTPTGAPGEADAANQCWQPIRELRGPEELQELIPSREDLLEHLVESASPPQLRMVLVVGSLMDIPFPYEVAHKVSGQTNPDLDDVATSWARFKNRNPPGSAVRTQETADGQRWVSMHRDLASYLGRELSPADRRALHARIAETAWTEANNLPADYLDRRYGLVALSAEQWTASRNLGEAARKHVAAATLAEELLAYDLAESHYGRAKLAFEQCVDADERRVEERLGLAHCCYRVARLRLTAGDRDRGECFDEARRVLCATEALLRQRLHDLDRTGADPLAQAQEVTPLRTNLRRCYALQSYVEFAMAQRARLDDGPGSASAANLYCEALQHAEAARGEGESRWVLAAASARLAGLLLEEAAELLVNRISEASADRAEQDRADDHRVEMLTRNAIFHAERAVGLQALERSEEQQLAAPKAWAYQVLGRVHQWIALMPDMAQTYFRSMNRRSTLSGDTLDRNTDLALALFELSVIQGDELDALRACLERAQRTERWDESRERIDEIDRPTRVATVLHEYLRWTEAFRVPEHLAAAHAGLALAWLAATRGDTSALPDAWEHVQHHARAAAETVDDHAIARTRILLLSGLVADVTGQPHDAAKLYQEALGSARSEPETLDEIVLEEGRRAALGRLLLELPAPTLSGVEQWFDDEACARDAAFTTAVERAERYCRRASKLASVEPPFDDMAWQLALARLPSQLRRHTETVRDRSETLARACLADKSESVCAEAIRDLALAAAIHDWFTDIDSARLLVLALEWDLPMSGVEWANPALLHGRLAVEAVRRLYDGEGRVGTDRFGRIERIVLEHTVGSPEATLLEKIFVLADWSAHQPPSAVAALGGEDEVSRAYLEVFRQKVADVRRRGDLVSPKTAQLLRGDRPGAGG